MFITWTRTALPLTDKGEEMQCIPYVHIYNRSYSDIYHIYTYAMDLTQIYIKYTHTYTMDLTEMYTICTHI